MANATDWSTLESATAIANNPLGQDYSEYGSPTYASGKFGNGLQGTASAGLTCDASTFWPDNGKGALEYWWLPASISGGAGIHFNFTSTGGNPTFNLGQISGATWRWFFGIEGGAQYMNVSEAVGNVGADGVLVHIAFSWDSAGIQGEGGNTIISFVDGVQTQTSSTTWTPIAFNNTGIDILGASVSGGAPINGVMDNFKVYPTAVTDWSHRNAKRGGLGDTITTI